MAGRKSDDPLKTRAAIIKAAHRKARASSRQSLELMRQAGQALREVKAELKGSRGAFGKWCDAEIPFDRVSRRNLMSLAENWTEVLAAIEAQPNDAKSWSVAGALKALVAAQKQPEKTPDVDIPALQRKVDRTRVRLQELEAELAMRCSLSEQLEPPIEPVRPVDEPEAEPMPEAEIVEKPESNVCPLQRSLNRHERRRRDSIDRRRRKVG